jgi:hypothetical protein
MPSDVGADLLGAIVAEIFMRVAPVVADNRARSRMRAGDRRKGADQVRNMTTVEEGAHERI